MNGTVKLFRGGSKNYAIFQVNVKTLKKIAQIFSEKLNFKVSFMRIFLKHESGKVRF